MILLIVSKEYSKKIEIKKNFPTKKFWFEILTQVLSIEFKKMMNWEEVILLLQVYELLSQWKVGWFSSSLDIKYFIGSGFSQKKKEERNSKTQHMNNCILTFACRSRQSTSWHQCCGHNSIFLFLRKCDIDHSSINMLFVL